MKKKKKFSKKDEKLKKWLDKGGREGSKKDFLSLLRLSSQPSKTSQK